MGRAHPREAAQGQEEEEVAVEVAAEWAEREPAPGPVVNAFAHLAGRLLPTRLGSHATSSNAPTAEPPW